MKKILSKLSLLVLLASLCGMFVACDETGKGGSFSVTVKEVGPGYVDLYFSAPEALEVAYILDTKEKLMNNPAVMFISGKTMVVRPDETVRLTNGIDEMTQYYLYIVAKLNQAEYSEILTIPFKTTKYNFEVDERNFLNVVDRSYDGYQMRITVPEETKERGNAIRYSQCDLMQYNYSRQTGNDDYFSLLYNGGVWFTDEDITASFNEELNWYLTGQDTDADGDEDWANYWNSISPGEPVVFIAGEFAYMEDTPDYENEVFGYPAGWPAGFYLPQIDPKYYGRNFGDAEDDGGDDTEDDEESSIEQSTMGVITDWNLDQPLDDHWTGAFQRKIFHTKEPSVLDAGVQIDLVDVSPIEAYIKFTPDEDVYQYCVGIFDAATYNQMLKLLTLEDGTILDEYLQWSVTSYFSAYIFSTFALKGTQTIRLSDLFYVTNLPEQATMYVLVTAMGDVYGSTQSFQQTSFQLEPKVLPEPQIIVTADMENSSPYVAAFNIRCENYEQVPLTRAYYAANYVRDWKLALNAGSTYSSLVLSNAAVGFFTEEELNGWEVINKDGTVTKYPGINSKEGYTIKIPSVDGEQTRMVVLGYNEELTHNNVDKYDFIEECPAAADVTTPFADPKPYVSPTHYMDLKGDWTISALLQNGADEDDTFTYTSKVTITDNLNDYPATLSDEVYDIYKKAGKEKDDVDGYYNEFKELAATIADERLANQNRLLCMGWFDNGQYGRLDTRTPYDLFIAKDYSSVDVSSIYNDYGPKWYIEAVEDEEGNVSLVVPFDSNVLPPTLNWSVPFYLCAMEIDNYQTVMYIEPEDPAHPEKSMLSFPVVVSDDREKITIKPFIYGGIPYYPNIIGLDSVYGTLLDYPVVSEITLTRGWSDTPSESAAAPYSGGAEVTAPYVAPYKARTRLDADEAKVITRKHVSVDQVKARADKYMENIKNLSSAR